MTRPSLKSLANNNAPAAEAAPAPLAAVTPKLLIDLRANDTDLVIIDTGPVAVHLAVAAKLAGLEVAILDHIPSGARGRQ
jgi:hypothetical protein